MSSFFQDPPRLGNQYDDDALLREYLARVFEPDALRALEPEYRELGELGGGALHAAMGAGDIVDVTVDSIAADSLGARRTSHMALQAAHHHDVHGVLVSDSEIIRTRQALWDHRRLTVEHGAATALAALTSGAYQPSPGETIAVVLCGANTGLTDLA